MSEHRVRATGQHRRLGHMALAITIGVSIAGFLLGVRDRREPEPVMSVARENNDHAEDRAPVVVDYALMTTVTRGPNAQWKQSLPVFRDDATQFYGDRSATDEQRAAAVATRGERRAFSGAPPVVPHASDQRNAQACMACHGAGFQVGQVTAPRMSHHYLPNCTQCHVEGQQNTPWASTAPPLTEFQFVGLREPGRGERIGPGAPPTIPHPMWMRTSCTSCHGTLAREGLRTSHPWRTNCTQCHAPQRGFDWSPLEVPPPPTRESPPPLGPLAQGYAL